MFTLNNNGDPAIGLIQPLHWNPAVMFRMARVIAGGQVIEYIDDFNRLSLMMTALNHRMIKRRSRWKVLACLIKNVTKRLGV